MEPVDVTALQAMEIRNRFKSGAARSELAQEYELSQGVIGKIIRHEEQGTAAQAKQELKASVHNRTNPRGQKHAPRKNWY